MTMYTKEQLNDCTKEGLVDIVLDMQNRFSVIEERIAAMNVNTYGRKTEKVLSADPNQLNFLNEMEAIEDGIEYADGSEAEPETEEITYSRKKAKGKRKLDLEGLPKVIENHEIPEEELVAKFGENGWKRLPDQVYSKLEVKPAQFTVIEHHIAVYASKKTDKIIKAKHPVELLNNSIATSSLVSGVMNGKFANAMPFYRIEKEFATYGAPVSRQDMAHWVIKCCEVYLNLVYDRMHEILKKEHVIQADETPAYVTKDGKEAGSKSYMWVFRTGEYSKEKPIILYKWANGRATDHPSEFLKGYKGYLECDGYSGYKRLDTIYDDINICCCWAHARRRFSDAVKAYGLKSPGVQDTLAYRALEKIGTIYHLDEKFNNLSPEERLKRRQTTITRRVDAFFAWAKEHQNDTGKQDLTYKGFSYCINQEKYLRKFLEDGEIPLDNSATERAIRPFTVSRKTWKLIDTPSGADASATMYSIVETAKANNIKVYDYLKLLLDEIPKHMDGKDTDFLDELMPWSETVKARCQKKIKTE